MAFKLKSEWVGLKDYLNLLDHKFIQGSSMYHRESWLKLICNSFDADIRGIVTADEHGNVKALTPFMVVNKTFFKLIGSPLRGLFTEFAGPLISDDVPERNVNSILRSQSSLACSFADYIEWGVKGGSKISSNMSSVLTHLGYTHISRPTIIVNLIGNEEKIWSNFKGRARNMIKKATKYGVVSKIIQPTTEWINNFYLMLEKTYVRQNLPVPHPLSFYLELMKTSQTGYSYFVSSEYEDRTIAKAIFLHDGERMIYLSGTSSEEGFKLAANSQVQWVAIQSAIVEGVTVYDMGGAGVPSIDKFKRSFGGNDFNHDRWVYKKSVFRFIEPLARLAFKRGYIRFNAN